jgi:hypothetical protein
VIGLIAVFRGIDGKPFFFEPLAQCPGQVFVVFNEENSHGSAQNGRVLINEKIVTTGA